MTRYFKDNENQYLWVMNNRQTGIAINLRTKDITRATVFTQDGWDNPEKHDLFEYTNFPVYLVIPA